MLEIDSVRVQFGGVVALSDVTLEVGAGLVTGLIGPNGAGKTTLFNVVTGLQRVNRGKVRLDGKDMTNVSSQRRARLGIARTFQRLEIFGSLSVRENVLVAAEARGRAEVRKLSAATLADQILDRLRLTRIAEFSADALPTGQARLVELLLDEPSAGLNATETARIGDLLRELAGDGMGVLLVEHDMSLVMDCCDLIYVLDFGELIAQGTPAQIQVDPAVQKAYLGDVDVEASSQADRS
jgi:branched-chain amino acid transport system ATP-binding protein